MTVDAITGSPAKVAGYVTVCLARYMGSFKCHLYETARIGLRDKNIVWICS